MGTAWTPANIKHLAAFFARYEPPSRAEIIRRHLQTLLADANAERGTAYYQRATATSEDARTKAGERIAKIDEIIVRLEFRLSLVSH